MTGIVVNETPNAPAEYRRRLRQELRFCRKFGVSDHMARLGIPGSEEHYLHHLLGRVNYVLQIAPEKAEFLQAPVLAAPAAFLQREGQALVC